MGLGEDNWAEMRVPEGEMHWAEIHMVHQEDTPIT